MNDHIQALLNKNWIQRWNPCAWGSMIVLTPKPHQEKIDDINSFIAPVIARGTVHVR